MHSVYHVTTATPEDIGVSKKMRDYMQEENTKPQGYKRIAFYIKIEHIQNIYWNIEHSYFKSVDFASEGLLFKINEYSLNASCQRETLL